MSYQEILENRRKQGNLNVVSNIDPEKAFDSEYFGIDNMRNIIQCLDLRFADGSRTALTYSYIVEINYMASDGILITTPTKQIKITGRDLTRLYDYLVSFRVRYIQENIGTDFEDSGLFVKCILMKEL